MNVYVESNYILEMVFEQAEASVCEELLILAESSKIQLIVPSLALVEPQETVRRRRIDRDRATIEFNPTLKDVSEHQHLGPTVRQTMTDVEKLLLHFSQEEYNRLKIVSARLLEHASILPMGLDTLTRAQQLQQQCDIQLFDAIMVAAVLMDLDQAAGVSCFLNRNRRDFDTSAVLHELRRRDCRLITKFRQGLDFVRSATERRSA